MRRARGSEGRRSVAAPGPAGERIGRNRMTGRAAHRAGRPRPATGRAAAGWIARTAPWGGPSTEDGPVAAAATDGGPGRFPGRDVGSAASDGSSLPPDAVGDRPKGSPLPSPGPSSQGRGSLLPWVGERDARIFDGGRFGADGRVPPRRRRRERQRHGPRRPSSATRSRLHGDEGDVDARRSGAGGCTVIARHVAPRYRAGWTCASRHPVRGHDGIRAAAPSGRPKPEPVRRPDCAVGRTGRRASPPTPRRG